MVFLHHSAFLRDMEVTATAGSAILSAVITQIHLLYTDSPLKIFYQFFSDHFLPDILYLAQAADLHFSGGEDLSVFGL